MRFYFWLCLIQVCGIYSVLNACPQPYIYKIADAKKLKEAAVVTVAGRISASNVFGDLTFIQDATGGIALYSKTNSTKLSDGDSVIVTGVITIYKTMVEILPTEITIVEPGPEIVPRTIAPKELSNVDGQLVQLKDLIPLTKTYLYPQRRGQMLCANDTVEFWIDGDTNIPGAVLSSTCPSLVGVVISYNGRYQVMPRSLTDIALARLPPRFIKDPTRFSVLNWNVEFLGATRADYKSEFGPADDALQLSNVARLLSSIGADLIALQEVSSDAVFDDLLDRMRGYAGICSERYSHSFEGPSNDFPPQKLCFLYRKNTVAVQRARPMFAQLFDDARSVRSALLDNAPGGRGSIFSSGRLPYQLDMTITTGETTRLVTVINLHGKSGASNEDRRRRQFDADLLKDSIDRYFANRSLLLVGDFNDDVDVSIVAGQPSPYRNFVVDTSYAFLTRPLSEQSWQSTLSYPDMIDHQLARGPILRAAHQTTLMNPFSLIQRYGTTTSDHLPVITEFDFNPLVTGVPSLVSDTIPFIYPNPTSGRIQINTTGTLVLTVHSAIGNQLISVAGPANQVCEDVSAHLSNASEGMYYVRICREGACYSRPLLVQRN